MNNVRTECDLLVVGSGASGLAAAVRAAWLGLKVVVIEKEAVFGGTTAWSGGWLWIPRNHLAQEAGIVEDKALPKGYLQAELGDKFDENRVDAFLDTAPEMVKFFHDNTSLQFLPGNAIPDFHGHQINAGTGGRSVTAKPFDARGLGKAVTALRRPLPEISFWGMGIGSGQDLAHFLNFLRTPSSTWYVVKRVTRHLFDLMLHRRGMQLVNGNALVARLAKSALDLGVELKVSTAARSIERDASGRIRTLYARQKDGSELEIDIKGGLVLACGGFPHDSERLKQLLPHCPTGHEHYSAAPKTNTGDGLRLGESVGAYIDTSLKSAAAYAPVSLVRRNDGECAHFPHLLERAKPGVIAVLPNGKRFVNEAGSYHDYINEQLAVTKPGEPSISWLICDHAFLRRFGLGNVKPFPLPYKQHLRSGYLKRGKTLRELAGECGIDAAGLEATLAEYNHHARQGEDPLFGRGDTAYNRIQGDAEQAPNPCVRPIETGPFYAVRIEQGSLGTFVGMQTNQHAQVLDSNKQPIEGLYAAGTDMASIMGGTYPAGGINLGPGMTFGYIAANHVASQLKLKNPT
ncbi:Succinate dehydrogenase/fumarate reductase, flavoprotein subunit [Marinobacterium lacunae]|uniref:Succinate dehydrogenase/fumarate reductase, flavoprotein subunit n=1 Tax=Marinobacterium lacunae TaxID=1232683 RepID=A0A081G4T4_9GAMM|nr:FAD-dependent oxidoreductase [Marinobacterium lacunae]KEA65789.1 Succinate dehydrogenase/fumarate reductase, flavoprotein subunit [Marinobacterium lacunae]